jgi:hypothetical protein
MPLPKLTIEQLVRLQPTIVGIIRWKHFVGEPAGDPCAAFDILVEEHTATQYRDAGGGHIVPEPGTGIFKVVSPAISFRALSKEGENRAISFQVSGLHHTMPFDGYYRVTPTLKGNWHPSSIFAAAYLAIVPVSTNAVLKIDAPVQSCEFEVERRSWFFGTSL